MKSDDEIEKSMRRRDAILNDPILAALRKKEVERRKLVVSPLRMAYGRDGVAVYESLESDSERAARAEFERLSRERIEEIIAGKGAPP